MTKAIIVFLILQVVYVVLNTITSIMKIKSGKLIASISSAICYAFYVYVLIATATDSFAPWVKAILVAITNFVGVYVSMWVFDKCKKDKLWQIVATVKANEIGLTYSLDSVLVENDIAFTCIPTSKPNEYVYNIYSKSQNESRVVKNLLEIHNAKYVINEQGARL